MNEANIHKLLIDALKVVPIVAVAYLVLRFLCQKGVERSERSLKKVRLLIEEYKTYSTDDLLGLLQGVEKKGMYDISAVFGAVRSRMEEEKIRRCVEQLQKSKHFLVKKNAELVMKDYIEGNLNIKPAEDAREN